MANHMQQHFAGARVVTHLCHTDLQYLAEDSAPCTCSRRETSPLLRCLFTMSACSADDDIHPTPIHAAVQQSAAAVDSAAVAT